jgi:hypothetical protein
MRREACRGNRAYNECVTWAFVYLVSLLVGTILAAVSGLLGNLRALFQPQAEVPGAHHHPTVPTLIGRRVAAGLCAFGLVGLVLVTRGFPHYKDALVGALVAGVTAALLATLLVRRPRNSRRHFGLATVVRDIPPGGYGQIRISEGARGLLLAAQSDDPAVIPAGSAVEVVDTDRTVVLVRRADTA